MILIPSTLHIKEASSKFTSWLQRSGWIMSQHHVAFASFGDSVDDYCTAIFGVHQCTNSVVTPMSIIEPPPIRSKPVANYIHDAYHNQSYSISFARRYIEQYSDDSLVAVDPMPTPSHATNQHSKRLYDLVPTASVGLPTLGCGVYDTGHLFPPSVSSTDGTFGHFFGIEFPALGIELVRCISPYEIVRGFGFDDTTAQTLAKQSNIHLLVSAIPTHTSAALLDNICSRLRDIRDASVVIDDSTPYAAPAATAQVLLNGSSTQTLPDEEIWHRAYVSDPETKLIFAIISNPSLMTSANMKKLCYIYCPYLRHGQVSVTKSGMLVLYEQLQGSDDMIELQIVPRSLHNVVFCAFHANPVGGHFSAYRTFHRIRLRYFWPRMYSYSEKLCKQCAGCRLANPGIQKSVELVYNFPVTEPLSVMHLDGYSAGALKSYNGCSSYLVAACNMTSFGIIEGIEHADATSFTAALMKMQLRYGFFRVLVLDKDSKFYATFRETVQLNSQASDPYSQPRES